MACTILEGGFRIDELPTARVSDFDLDNLLVTVVGKDRIHGKVPLSTELRKVLFRFAQVKERAGVKSELMCSARHGARGGHCEVSTTMKYLHLLTEDLQRPHQGLSILNRLR